jgi:predicted Zn-dependent protease
MTPLLRVMDHPRPLDQVKVAILDDPNINAASAGGGEFQVTTGLLQKANDVQLAGVLAHELAHDDLGHVAKAQTLDLAAFIEVHDPHVIVYDRPRPYENTGTSLMWLTSRSAAAP